MEYRKLSWWEKEEIILKVLEVYPHGMSVNDLASTLGIWQNIARADLDKLASEGKIKKNKIGKMFIYFRGEF